MAKQNIFKKASVYRKAHPRLSFQDAVKAVSGKSTAVSGVKKKKRVTAISGKKPVKRTVVVKVGKVAPRKAIGAVDKGMAIINEINKLENQRKKIKTKMQKDFLALIINKEHDKLDALQRQLKRR